MIESSPRILVIKLRYLGDVLLTTPLFDALRSHFPDAFIAAAVNKGTEDMLTDNPAINKIFTVERDSNFLSDLQKQLQLIREIRNFKFDIVLELTNNDRARATIGPASLSLYRLIGQSNALRSYGPSAAIQAGISSATRGRQAALE